MNAEIKRITLIAIDRGVAPSTINLGLDWEKLHCIICGEVRWAKKDGTGFSMQLNGLYAMVVER